MSMEDERFVVVAEQLGSRTQRQVISHRGGAALRWEEVIALWRTDAAFTLFFTAVLAASPFDSFYFECPPLAAATAADPFEFVLVQAHGFARADPSDFAEHIGRSGVGAVTFANLGGDATLVAPTGTLHS